MKSAIRATNDSHPQLVSVDSTTIDRIVANVLQQLGARGDGARSSGELSANVKRPFSRDPQGSATAGTARVALDDRVITADLLAQSVNGAAIVAIAPKAILTPSARDFIRSAVSGSIAAKAAVPVARRHRPDQTWLPPLNPQLRTPTPPRRRPQHRCRGQTLTDLQATWSRELLGCRRCGVARDPGNRSRRGEDGRDPGRADPSGGLPGEPELSGEGGGDPGRGRDRGGPPAVAGERVVYRPDAEELVRTAESVERRCEVIALRSGASRRVRSQAGAWERGI